MRPDRVETVGRNHKLAIGLTNRCPLRCDFCCVPPGRGDLPDPVVRRIAREAIELGKFSSVGFTGGEPLLRWRIVTEAGREIVEAGMTWGFTTGLGWVRELRHMHHVVDKVLLAGVDHISVSVDASHLAFVDRRFAEAFLERVAGAGVRRVIVSCTSRDDSAVVPVAVPDLPNVETEFHYVSPVGNASGESPGLGSRRFSMSESVCPMRDGLTLSVWPDGAVYPCCSTYVVNKAPARDLVVGNIFDSTLEDILDTALRDPFLTTIGLAGFAGLVVLDPLNPVWPSVFEADRGPLQDVCHLCSRVASHRGAISSLRSAVGSTVNKIAQQSSADAAVGVQ